MKKSKLIKIIKEEINNTLSEQEIDRERLDQMMKGADDMFGDDPFSNKESPKIKELKQRLSRLGFTEEEVEQFIESEALGEFTQSAKEKELEKKIIALENFANTPFNKMPQKLKITPGEDFEISYNRLNWSGKVGDASAPKWVQILVPGWKTNNPAYPNSPTTLGSYGHTLLIRKLKAAFAQTQ